MNESQLQIIISVVNEAADQLQGVSSQLASMASSASESAAEISDAFSTTGESIATDVAAGTIAASAAVDGLSDEITEKATEMDEAFSGLNEKMLMVGIQAGLIGAAIAAPAVEAIKAAGDQEDAFDQLSNTISNVYASVGASTAGASTEIAALTAKINGEQSTIAEAQAALTKYSGTTAEVAAAHEKANSTIATAQVAIQKYQQELDNLTNSQSLAGSTAAETTAQFEAAAKASTSLGFDVTDSATSLQYLFSATQSVTETMSAYQDAMDLSAKLQIPVTQAANDIVQAMNGQGRALRDLGVNVADGLSGQTALAAIQEKVAGAAALAATQGLGPMSVAQAKLNQTLVDFGAAALPALNQFFTIVTKVITAVDQWAQAHPKLAEAIVIFIGVIGGLLIALGAVMLVLSPIIILFAAFGATTVGVAAAIGVAIALLAALIITNWSRIRTETAQLAADFEAIWNALGNWWTTFWNNIFNVIQTIWNKVEAVINSIRSAVGGITGAVSGIAGSIGSGTSQVIKAFASGGIVNSPTLALVGEAGPEAIIPLSAFNGGSSLAAAGGSAGSINVYIQGGMYLDQGGANMIASALATQIGRQMKLKNYF